MISYDSTRTAVSSNYLPVIPVWVERGKRLKPAPQTKTKRAKSMNEDLDDPEKNK